MAAGNSSGGVSFSKKELEEFLERARSWQKGDVDSLESYINTERLVMWQVLGKMATTPINTRSGPRVNIAAVKEWSRVAVEIEKALETKRQRKRD